MQILKYISQFSPVIPIAIGFIRWKRLPGIYLTLVLYCVLSIATEAVTNILLAHGKSNSVDLNIFFLLEFVILLRLFAGINKSVSTVRFIKIVLIIGTFLWIVETIFFQRISANSIAVHLFFCAALVFVSLQQISQVITEERGNLFLNHDFIISSAVLIFFSYSLIVEVPYLFKLDIDWAIYDFMAEIFRTLNLLFYLAFAIALLWIPPKRKYMLPY